LELFWITARSSSIVVESPGRNVIVWLSVGRGVNWAGQSKTHAYQDCGHDHQSAVRLHIQSSSSSSGVLFSSLSSLLNPVPGITVRGSKVDVTQLGKVGCHPSFPGTLGCAAGQFRLREPFCQSGAVSQRDARLPTIAQVDLTHFGGGSKSRAKFVT
jgi:hypothetical protein